MARTIFPYPLYGLDCNAYLTLMGQYYAGKAREYAQVASYLNPDTGYTSGNSQKDPPWKGSLKKYLSVLDGDIASKEKDISFLLYIPVKRDEWLDVKVEVLRWKDMKPIAKMATQTFHNSDTTISDVNTPVHYSSPSQSYGHARIEASATDGVVLKDILMEGGTLEYYLFRITTRSNYNGEFYHWEDTGVLEIHNDLNS